MVKILTIVIAAYNKQDLLPRCLNSLIIAPELMQKVQVLVVNDGSTDNTLSVAKKYEEKYPECFQIIDKKNGNYGSVMNTALPLAKGIYFRTLDADDWYDTNAYIDFIGVLERTDADMIVTERYTFDEKSQKKEKNELGDIKNGEDIPIDQSFTDVSVFNKCLNVPNITYKTSLIKESGLKWIEGIFYTDTMFDVWPLPLVKTIRCERLPVYVYVEGLAEQSMTVENTRKNVSHFVAIANEFIPYFVKYYNENTAATKIMKYFLFQLLLFVYGNMWIDDKYNDVISKIHHQLDAVPFVQKEFEQVYTYRGINCLRDIYDNKISVAFRVIRPLRKISQRIKRHIGIQ